MQAFSYRQIKRNGTIVKYVGESNWIRGHVMNDVGYACCAVEGCDVTGLRCAHRVVLFVPVGYEGRGDDAIFRLTRDKVRVGYREGRVAAGKPARTPVSSENEAIGQDSADRQVEQPSLPLFATRRRLRSIIVRG